MKLKILTGTAYYAGRDGPPTGYGNTPWLNEPMTITDWGHRACRTCCLTLRRSRAAGVWNAAHYKNKKYDAAGQVVLGAVAARGPAQVREADRADRCCEETPVIFPYFYNSLDAGSKKVKGYKADAARPDVPEQDVARLART